jgi:PKD domain-containing protein
MSLFESVILRRNCRIGFKQNPGGAQGAQASRLLARETRVPALRHFSLTSHAVNNRNAVANEALIDVSQMRIAACLLLIGLFASGLYFASRETTLAQQAGTVNLRPRVASAQSGMPEVKATVNRNKVPVGEEVTFTLSPARIVTDPRYRVTLFFGDGKRQVMHQSKTFHPYPKAGTYTYSILVEPDKQPPPPPTPTPIPNVKLTVTPIQVEVNRPVSFSAQLSRRYPNIKYRFVFADGSDTGWQDNSNATHSYRSPNTYKAYVDIGVLSNGSIKQAGGSQRESIKVTESSRVSATVKLSANPTSVETDKAVTFTARVTPQSAGAKYRFDFGDQSPPTAWQESPRTTHRYKSARKYSARVEVRGTNRNSPTSTINDSVTIEVSGKSDEKSAVDLKVVPGSVLVGVPVFFQAVPSAANSRARYRFDFGDGSSATTWSSDPVQTHIYSAAGRYPAFVEMAESGTEPARSSAVSEKKSVRVTAISFTNNTNDNRNNNTNANANSNSTPRANVNANRNGNANVAGNINSNSNGNANANTNVNSNRNANSNLNSNIAGNRNTNATNNSPSPSASEVIPPGGETEPGDWWWWYLIVAAIVSFAGYQAYSYLIVPRPTFVPHSDVGDSNVSADNPLSIDLQMDVDPNVTGGEFEIDTEGNNLIKSQRIEP